MHPESDDYAKECVIIKYDCALISSVSSFSSYYLIMYQYVKI